MAEKNGVKNGLFILLESSVTLTMWQSAKEARQEALINAAHKPFKKVSCYAYKKCEITITIAITCQNMPIYGQKHFLGIFQLLTI